MSFFRVACVFVLLGGASASVASAANEVPAKIATKKTPVGGDERFLVGLGTFPLSTPLAKIPVYQLQPGLSDGELAVKGLNSEIERLYIYAKTLASGADRRAFESRIYFLDKRLRPLIGAFDLPIWEALRADVSREWSVILAGFVPVVTVPPSVPVSIE